MRRIEIYDTTLRDGAQAEGISFSLPDKLLLTQRLAPPLLTPIRFLRLKLSSASPCLPHPPQSRRLLDLPKFRRKPCATANHLQQTKANAQRHINR